jgi:hypothetical protein
MLATSMMLSPMQVGQITAAPAASTWHMHCSTASSEEALHVSHQAGLTTALVMPTTKARHRWLEG